MTIQTEPFRIEHDSLWTADPDSENSLWLADFWGDASPEVRRLIAEAPAMLAALRFVGAEIAAWADEENPDGAPTPNELAARIAVRVGQVLRRLDGDPDADLIEAAGDDVCLACLRPSLDCSRAPCPDVAADRGEAA